MLAFSQGSHSSQSLKVSHGLATLSISLKSLVKIYSNEGLKSFWKGVAPAMTEF
ncbi:hypothetical protein Syun_016897 [Stephania yunnanensis]|uniref:Uncharacterized protein n=1 Tax=Stephania yunnanensis TaxID=152371 RepID=A0AAP0J7H9_9MAGN